MAIEPNHTIVPAHDPLMEILTGAATGGQA